jgi:Zn-dependent protease
MLGPAFKIATVWGIPIRVHITLVLLFPFLAWHFRLGFGYGVVLALALFASIVLHELGHSLVCLRCGCRVREILLLPIGGAARMEQMPRRPRDELLMALAGPLVSLLLFVLLFYGVARLPLPRLLMRVEGGTVALSLASLVGLANLGLALFNLLPAFPMDGGRVLRAALTPRWGRLQATRIATIVGRAIAVVFVVYGLRAPGAHLTLILIGAFIFWAAGVEYRQVQRQELQPRFPWAAWGWRPFATSDGAAPLADEEVTVSPSPYSGEGVRKGPVRRRRWFGR